MRRTIAVVGGGGAGWTAAILAAHAGCAVTMIAPPPAPADGRTIALLDGSVRLLRSLGVWERLADGAAPLAAMRLVDDTGSLFRTPPVEFRAVEIGLDAFGWNVEARALTLALSEAGRAEPGLVHRETTVVDAAFSQDGAELVLADGDRVAADLVIAADGRRSALRGLAGVRATERDYDQVALTAIFRHAAPHGEVSTEFHTRSGPCTLVPMPGRRSSLVWMMTPAEADRRAALPDADFACEVERATHAILGAMTLDGPRGRTPMRLTTVNRLTATRLALVGEAAHAFPPIGAQGFNLSMRDAAHLAEAIETALASEGDVGGDAVLADYARRRRLDVRVRAMAVDALNRSLLTDLLPVDFARGFGLAALDLVGPLRRAVMREGLAPQRGAPRRMARETA